MKHISRIQFGDKKSHPLNLFVLVLGVVILVSSIKLTIGSVKQHQQLIKEIQATEKLDLKQKQKKPDPILTQAQKDIYKNIAHLFDYPWQQFFIALEKTNMQQVALLSLEPNIQTGELKLSAEADDIHAMFTYIEALKTQANIQSVELINQYNSGDAGQTKVTFELDLKIRKK